MNEESTDEALLRRYQDGGDVQAFELLVRRHRQPLFNFISRFVGRRDKAEDVLQEVFLKMATRAADFEGRAKVRTWLYTIARNASLDELRKFKHRNALSLDTSGTDREDSRPIIDRVSSADISPDRAASSARLQPMLISAIAALPQDQREVFLLREYAGVPFAEIAAITSQGVNTVKSRMRYALEGLRKSLEEMGVERFEGRFDEGAGEVEGL